MSLSIRFVPSHIKNMLFDLIIIKKKDNGNPIDTSIVVPIMGRGLIALLG